MRLTTFLLPMFGICCAAFPQASQQPTISIESRNPAVKSGQPIQIRIILKNTTDREFTVFRSGGGASGELYYSVSLTGPDGSPAALTDYGEAVQKKQGVPGSKIMRHVAPGGEADDARRTIYESTKPSPHLRSNCLFGRYGLRCTSVT